MSLSNIGKGSVFGAVCLSLVLAGCGSPSGNTTGGTSSNQASSSNSSTNASTKSANSASSANTSSNTSAATQSSGSKKITIGYVNWSEDVATTYLWKTLLEQKGYQVQLKTLALGPMFTGLSGGGVDLFFDSWLPEQKNYLKKYKTTVTTLGKWYAGKTTEGFVVPTYMKNVNSIADLNKVASKLNDQIVGIDPGAVEMKLADNAVKKYGLKVHVTQSSAPAMLSALKRAYSQHKDVAVVLWSPHWAFATYKLKYLKDPKKVFGSAGWIQSEANKKWVQSHGTASKWLNNFKINQQQLGELENDINHSKSKSAAVKKWISNNQSLVNSWFK